MRKKIRLTKLNFPLQYLLDNNFSPFFVLNALSEFAFALYDF